MAAKAPKRSDAQERTVKRYEVWCGDEYLGIFLEDEVQMMCEAGEPIRVISLDP